MDSQDTNTQVFNKICEIVLQPDFSDARFQFFEKNKDTFEDCEENKLEHTNIFKEYIMILEQIIETKLREAFSDDDIKGFYTTFKEKLPEYEKINSETVDTIFGFTDFDRFKQSMLTYKRGLDEGKEPAKKDKENTLPLHQLVGKDKEHLLKIFEDLNKEDTADPKNKWKKTLEIKEKDGLGCLVMQRPVEGRNVNLFKNSTVFRKVTIGAWLEFSTNFNEYMKDDPQFAKQNANPPTIVEKSEDKKHAIYFNKAKFGPMASDREILVQSDFIQLSDTKYLLVARSILMDAYPLNDTYVRMEYFRCQTVEEKDGDLHTIGFSNIDFGGYFPSSLMNMIISGMISGGKKNSYKMYRSIQDKIDSGAISPPK